MNDIQRIRTHAARDTMTLLQEAVEFAHPCQRSLCPSILLDDPFCLLSKWLDVLRVHRKVEKCMSKGLTMQYMSG